MKRGPERKKWYLLGAFAVVLAGLAFLNYRLSGNADKELTAAQPTDAPAVRAQAGISGAGDYFDMFRLERDEAREMEIGYLDEIIAAGATDSETLEEAQQQKLALVGNMEKEMVIETMIVAKGFRDAAVTFGSGTVNVVLDASEITEEQAAQILDIVLCETGFRAEQVKIVVNEQ